MAKIFYTQAGKATQQLSSDSEAGQALLESIKAKPMLGAYNNNWRQRRVEVYQHEEVNLVTSIGYGMREALGMIYVCDEDYEAYRGRIENNDWADYN